jgi:uncharacterized protein YbjT (DUF2867 family)
LYIWLLIIQAYTITGPEALSYYQVAEILSNATGKKIDYVNISKEDARRRLGKLSFLNNIMGIYKQETDENGNYEGTEWQWK